MAASPETRGKVRYGVVGAGWIAQAAFMPAVAGSGNSAMTALVTGNPGKASALAQLYGMTHVVGYDRYDELLGSGAVDAVYLALPNTMHCDYAVRAMNAGVHVLCEKPMACNEQECRAMIAAAAASRVKLMVAYRLHFEPATVGAIEAVQSGVIGEPRLFSATFAYRVVADNHRRRAELWAGPVPDLGPYPVNTARHAFEAEPIEAMATLARTPPWRADKVVELVSVVLRFPGERLAVFTVGFGLELIDTYRVSGTSGDLELDPAFGFGVGLRHRLRREQRTTAEQFAPVDQFAGEIRHFSERILDGREPEPDGEEGLADVRVLSAIERALETGRAQPLETFVRGRPYKPGPVMRIPPVRPPALVNAAPPFGGVRPPSGKAGQT